MKTQKLKVGVITGYSLSGGHNVIFEHISRIHKRGNLDIYLIFDQDISNENLAWFSGIEEVKRLSLEKAKAMEFDIAVATFWRTCYQLKDLHAKSYVYFNQSVESKFYSVEEFNNRNAAEATYLLGLKIITEASWIQKYIKENYKEEAQLVLNGIRKENYQLEGEVWANRDISKLRVLIEGNLSSSFKNVARTIELCKESLADEIWLLTNSKIDHIEGVDRIFSNIPMNETQKIFRSCDVLVKLSTVEGMFGPPLEMFHCGGTAITYNVTGHEEYMVHNHNSLIANMHDEAMIVRYINELKEHPEKLASLKKNAYVTSLEWYDWDAASLGFEQALISCYQEPNLPHTVLKQKISILNNWYSNYQILLDENQSLKKKLGLKIHNFIKKRFLS